MTAFAELCVTSNFSFLRGGSHPEQLVPQAALLGMAGIAFTDRNTLAGVVRGHVMMRQLAQDLNDRRDKGEAVEDLKLRYAVGCRLAFRDGTPDVFAWPTDRAAYGRLCRLLTAGNIRAEKGQCHLDLADLLEWGNGMILGIMPGRHLDAALDRTLGAVKSAFPQNTRLMLTRPYGSDDFRRMARVADAAKRFGTPLLATNDVLYHAPEQRQLQDIVTCIREKTTLAEAGRRLQANAERHFKDAAEMRRLFRDFPGAVAESLAVLEQLNFSLDELRGLYPDESMGDGSGPQETLEKLAEAGAKIRYPDGLSDAARKTLEHELGLIRKLAYAPYFLTVRNIMEFARKEGILCQGRGSAANSMVCYCLHITEVDPMTGNGGLFERFISENRGEPPDIDVDFEHERREEVMQHVYRRYGRDKTALTATVITYRSRSALREVGKVFGLSDDAIGALSGTVWGWSSEGIPDKDVRRAGLEPSEPALRQVLDLARNLVGFPRHLSQHVGGFVMTRDRLDEMIPVMNAAMEERTTVEWSKDDLDALNILKVDVLALGMLTCIRRAFGFLEKHYGRRHTVAELRYAEEDAVYRMLQRADSLGTFQVESRAQMSMLPRLQPKEFYDLVIEVAIVRPGPIQGGMVHPYLRRKQGLEKVDYQTPALEKIVGKTLGVPLFQEQAMRIAIDCAGFNPGETDRIRRAMATFRRVGTIDKLKSRFVEGMVERNYPRDFAERCFSQIEGFGDYGFPESHAASFAILVYVSAWLKCHYPDVFCAAILNAQPMGFYAPAQLVRDAREHGIIVRAVDVNASDWDCTLENDGGFVAGRIHKRHAGMKDDIRSTHAVRLGFRQVKGFSEDDGRLVNQLRGAGYDSVRDLWLRTGLSRSVIERLADADAFRSLGLDRRDALWAARGLGGDRDRLPLLDAIGLADIRREPDFALPPMPLGEHVVNDYRYLSLSLKAHPVGFLRNILSGRAVLPTEALATMKTGTRVTVCGLVLIRQRPGTAKGVIFMTLEDETGIANAIVWARTFERFRPVVLGARLVAVTGPLQNESGVIHVVAEKIEDLSPMLGVLSHDADDLESRARADELKHGPTDDPRGRTKNKTLVRLARDEPGLLGDLARLSADAENVMPKGRNFH